MQSDYSFCVLMIVRDGSCPGVVVWNRMHAIHRPKELSTVWKWERHCSSQPQFWDRLPVWLDLLREVRSSWGKCPGGLKGGLHCGAVIHLLNKLSISIFFQSSKALAKKELSYIPIIGWMWYFLENVFCKRKWEEDRRTVAESLQNLHDYPEHFWVRFSSL